VKDCDRLFGCQFGVAMRAFQLLHKGSFMSNLIERLSGAGIGKVFFSQEFVAEVHYDVRTFGGFHPETTLLDGEKVRGPALDTTHITITPDGALNGWVGKRLTLHMSGSRKLDFWVLPDGKCEAYGSPYLDS
jgi:hypothetical protein